MSFGFISNLARQIGFNPDGLKYAKSTTTQGAIEDLDDALTTTNNKLVNLVVSESVTKTVTFNAISGDTSHHSAEGTFSVAKNGYIPISVEFGYTANVETYFTRLYLDGNTVVYTLITGWFSGDISQIFHVKYIKA